MSTQIRRVLIEALKPRDAALVELSQTICSVDGVEECDITVTDVDAKTETIKLTLRGPNIEYNEMLKVLHDHGVSIKGVDEINIAKAKKTLQKSPA
jgi:uncharacterized protein